MSYVVVVSTSSVLYTPPTGAENAFAGQTIASATWNAIFTDLCNNGLAVVGESPTLTLKGNAGASAAVVTDLTPVQVQSLLGQGIVAIKVAGVSFGTGGVDTPIPVVLPAGYMRYRFNSISLSQASGSISAATCGLFTASGGGGVAVVSLSSVITVTTSAENTNNNTQALTINNQVTQDFTASTLYFRTGLGTAAQTATVTIYIAPLS